MSDKPHIRVVAARIEQGGRYLITQRRPEAVLPLMWEFPGGRVEEGETPEEALIRELKEEMGIDVEVDQLALEVRHEYEPYTLDLLVFRARIVAGTPRPLRVHDLRWVSPEEFSRYQFPGADQQTVDALLSEQ